MMSVLRHLKRLKVDLPIEVFHYDDELRDEGQRRQIEELGAKVLVVRPMIFDPHGLLLIFVGTWVDERCRSMEGVSAVSSSEGLG